MSWTAQLPATGLSSLIEARWPAQAPLIRHAMATIRIVRMDFPLSSQAGAFECRRDDFAGLLLDGREMLLVAERLGVDSV